ncbi:N-acetylneuraminate anomerase [Serratia rhizosphaerae]|uniref:N-acetylneuraminate anomerase n=1 Tax=Serratia rhizosphaerae TaxID=2597702 RepID=UPI002DBDB046|nr:N-acetylneuraminate anomerase [Serratia rhizosphaerae]MEB6335243.1 YhcH/YjgK/YiaL family protein [Serratia rhizosphaerae]
MILNSLFNPRYGQGLSSDLAGILTQVRQQDLPNLPLGRHDIDGERIFMEVVELTTEPAEHKRAELHYQYLDIQILLSGEERIDYGLPGSEIHCEAYQQQQDCQQADIRRPWQTLHMTPGMFVLFFPFEPHKAGCQLHSPQRIKKAIVKVLYEPPYDF